MKALSNIKLRKLGFIQESWSVWYNGAITVNINIEEKTMDIFVTSNITTSEDYARPALGVENENDLKLLCRLINGNG